MLSDKGSEVIRRFGIFNNNIPPEQRSYGVPFPVEYLLAPDGTVRGKFFVPNYQNRVASSSLLMNEFGLATGPSTTIKSGPVTVRVQFSSERIFAGQQMGVVADFAIEPGWHIYGEPLPRRYTVTAIRFDNHYITNYGFKYPPMRNVELKAVGETLPVYEGNFRANGHFLLKFPLDPGDYVINGTLSFQPCSEQVCEPPRVIWFKVPIKIDPTVAQPSK